MKKVSIIFTILLVAGNILLAQPGIESITSSDLKSHLYFLAADEFKGRDTPSEELKMASRYLAVQAESYGLKPIMDNGSFFQEIPLRTSWLAEKSTYIKFDNKGKQAAFRYGADFGLRNRSLKAGKVSGEIVFLGLGLHAPEQGWDDYKGIDVTNKVAVILEAALPDDHHLRSDISGIVFRRRSDTLILKGASAVIYVISEWREKNFVQQQLVFENPVRASVVSDSKKGPSSDSRSKFYELEIRHSAAVEMLGISPGELTKMFKQVQNGEQVLSRIISGSKIEIQITTENKIEKTRNVLAYIEGSDSNLQDEFIVYGAHYDHVGAREGDIYNGANDNGSGSVALLEMAEAFMISPPKRSVVFAWFTGEEKGLWGSEYFVHHPPVPIDKITAHINLDVISGENPESIALVGHTRLSSELDQLVTRVNEECCGMDLDNYFEDPGPSNMFFFMSDHYPFIQYGIPSVWLFNGPEPNVHRPTDTPENINYEKMENVTRLAFSIGLEIANRDEILGLDVVPEIIVRGAHNTDFDWSKVIGVDY